MENKFETPEKEAITTTEREVNIEEEIARKYVWRAIEGLGGCIRDSADLKEKEGVTPDDEKKIDDLIRKLENANSKIGDVVKGL